MLPTKSNVNLIITNFPFSFSCQMESVIIYTKNTWMGEKNLNNMKLANGSWNGNKHPIKLCSKSKAQTELANKPLLAKLGWGLVA